MAANGNGDDGLPPAGGGLPVPDLRTMEELCQPTLNAKNITPPEPSPKTQGEVGYKELTLPVSEIKVNKESAMVLYNLKKDLVDLTTTENLIPKAPKLKPFPTPEGPLSQEEFDKQIKELKRISDLKDEKEKSEHELRKLLNPSTLKAQAHK
ncbi:hypothetical protein Tco_0843187 [Tanacetum coccineum]|uniref:Uncharacterized protein n=1 Tax=Tanacetum coccineum TaxID=301880 RepID=A0ABQ5B1X6_9ASTR